MSFQILPRLPRCTLYSSSPTLFLRGSRTVSTLPSNPHIYVHPHPLDSNTHVLSLLSNTPPSTALAIGTTTTLPPTPSSFHPNPAFLPILSSVLAAHASSDPAVQQQAAVFASPGGTPFTLSSPSLTTPSSPTRSKKQSDDGAGGASKQGGMGGAGAGGWIHVSDTRNPPDYGRIAWPEDIFGSLEVDGTGGVVDGSWQESGTYRVVTREGILGLTDYLRGKVVERLTALEKEETEQR